MIGILEMISKTPNQRHIHDSLQRAARDRVWEVQAARREEGREKGREEGLEKGVQIGQIRLLEQLLHNRPSDEHSLARLTLLELNQRVSALKEQLNLRGIS
jgi:predicted transposase YdaD